MHTPNKRSPSLFDGASIYVENLKLNKIVFTDTHQLKSNWVNISDELTSSNL